MRHRIAAVTLVIAALCSAACGSGPRSTSADLFAIRQPTPDPTLDAVVRDLPHALAGVAAPTPTPTAAIVAVQKPAAKATALPAKLSPATPTTKPPAPKPATPTPVAAHR
jgi:hypothetical protein